MLAVADALVPQLVGPAALPEGVQLARFCHSQVHAATWRRALEAILHPAIRARLEAICRAAPRPYAIATVPLLTEGGGRAAYPWLHRILVVDTPAAVQKARLMQRDGIDATLADQMMAAQASRAERLALADDIVVNDGDIHHLQHAADALHLRYLALATATP